MKRARARRHVSLADADPALQDGEVGLFRSYVRAMADEARRLVVLLQEEEGLREPDHRLQVGGVERQGLLVLLDGQLVVLAALRGGAGKIGARARPRRRAVARPTAESSDERTATTALASSFSTVSSLPDDALCREAAP